MSHDLRQALGYRRLPTRDPKEAAMRDTWYNTKDAAALGGEKERAEHEAAHRALSDYLWARTMAEIEADRKRHPKAKRNAPVGSRTEGKASPGGRYLP